MKSYEEIISQMTQSRKKVLDYSVPISEFYPMTDVEGKVYFSYEGQDFYPTRYAWDNIATICGVSRWQIEQLTSETSDRQDGNTLLALLANGFRRVDPKKPYLIRCHKDGTMRAVLGSGYRTVSNLELLEILSGILPEGQVTDWRGDSDNVYGNIMLPSTIKRKGNHDYYDCLFVSNSEIGKRSISIRSSITRFPSGNTYILAEKFKKNHSGLFDLHQLRKSIIEKLLDRPNNVNQLNCLDAIEWKNTTIRPILTVICQKFDLSKTINSSIFKCWRDEVNESPETNRTMLSVVNAISRAGHECPSYWLSMNLLAGKLITLTTGEWNAIMRWSRTVTYKQVAKSFTDFV